MTFFFNNNETGTGLTRKGHVGSCFVGKLDCYMNYLGCKAVYLA